MLAEPENMIYDNIMMGISFCFGTEYAYLKRCCKTESETLQLWVYLSNNYDSDF